jgi:hypothetical protein
MRKYDDSSSPQGYNKLFLFLVLRISMAKFFSISILALVTYYCRQTDEKLGVILVVQWEYCQFSE